MESARSCVLMEKEMRNVQTYVHFNRKVVRVKKKDRRTKRDYKGKEMELYTKMIKVVWINIFKD